jgi:hypothetical protein
MSNIVYLHGQPTPIVRFLRVTEHRRLDQLLEADKLPYERFVIEAGYFNEQRVLIDSLRQRRHQLVLDTNIAELSAVAKFTGHAKNAPWANPDGILSEEHLKSKAGIATMQAIARFAAANGFARVLAPNHFIPNAADPWLAVDLESCVALRRALDAEGGKEIAIDFPLMISNTLLNDGSQRRDLIAKLGSLPIDSIWSRVSGFGADATAAGLKKYISASQDFHSLGKPIVADGVGGLSALAIVAFGVACGLSHGVAAKERFDASNWYKPPKPGTGGGGGGHYVLLSGIDCLLKRADAEAIINASGGRRLASCNDRTCCPRGFEDTIKDPKGHFLRQRALQCDAISALAEPVRPQHFLDKDLTDADRRARLLAKLRLRDSKLSSRLVENAKRIDRMRDVLGSLEKTTASATRSPGFPSANTGREARKDRR